MTAGSMLWDWSRLDGNMEVEVRNFNINNFDELCVSGYEIERGLGELTTDIKPAAL